MPPSSDLQQLFQPRLSGAGPLPPARELARPVNRVDLTRHQRTTSLLGHQVLVRTRPVVTSPKLHQTRSSVLLVECGLADKYLYSQLLERPSSTNWPGPESPPKQFLASPSPT